MRLLLTALFTGVIYSYSIAQLTVQPRARTITTANGLPTNYVRGAVQDRTGFIWLATSEGLVRYDGHSFSVFRHENRVNTQAENNITHIQLMPDSTTLLLQTLTGILQQFDPLTGQFTTFLSGSQQGTRPLDEGAFSTDGKLFWALWRGQQQVRCYERRHGRSLSWTGHELGKAMHTLHAILPAASGKAYGHYDEGILELDPKTGTHRLFPFPGSLTRWMYLDHWSIDWKFCVERPSGELAIIGKKYLHLLDPKSGQYRQLAMPDAGPTGDVYGMRVLGDGKLYLAMGSQFYEFGPDNQFRLIYRWSAELPSQRVFGIPVLRDRSGMIWMLTEAGGITLLETQPPPFHTYTWQVGWRSDLLRILQHGVAPVFRTAPNKFPGDSWTKFTFANKHLWFIDLASLYQCTPEQHRVVWTTSDLDKSDSCSYKIALKADRRGHLWLYGNIKGGLTETDTNGHIIRYWPKSLLPQVLANRGQDVADLQVLGQNVWIASNHGKGLYQYSLQQQRIVRQWTNQPGNPQSLPGNQLLCLVADPFQPTVLWVGTEGNGLARFDIKTGQFRRFSLNEGLPSNTIQSLIADRQGQLWAATDQGLVRIDPRTFVTRVFTKDDGLQDDAYSYSLATQLPDGQLAFRGATGITIFNPAALRDNPSMPPVVLSELRINNTLVQPGDSASPLLKPLNVLTQLTLTHRQNFLTFTFAALDFNKPQKIHYRYRLSGVDKNWVEAGTQHTANYTQLQPGQYTFEVMATNGSGLWNPHSKQLAITITPPFWASWWAYALYTLVFGGAIYGLIRFRVRQNQQQQAIQLKQQEAEQLRAVDELKTRFFSNITHEFRTPLSLIIAPAEKLLHETKQDSATYQTLSVIERHAQQLLRLVNQLLDLAKLEANSMVETRARGNVMEFITQLVGSFSPAAEENNIRLHWNYPVAEGEHLFDADKLGKIVYNLLSNALKFTKPGGDVGVNVWIVDNQLGLTVSDTGIGIAVERLPSIFNRFYQIDDSHTRTYEGSGIGLALVKELTELIGGRVEVNSEVGVGTRFTLTMPIQLAQGHESPISPSYYKNGAARALGVGTKKEPEQPVDGNESAKPLLLIVEDNGDLRHFISDELGAEFQVITAENGDCGWELIQQELPDIVLSDVMMPGRDGYELTRLLKEDPATDHIAVVLLTAKTAHRSRIEGLERGADDYLTKPFHSDELRLRLHNLIDRQRKLQMYYQQQLRQVETPIQLEAVEDLFIRKLYTHIENRLDDSQLSVDDLARVFNMSRRTLHRKLTTLTRLSANDLIRNYRLKRAVELLRKGNSIAETAYQVGFDNPSYFSSVFKKTYGAAPREFVLRE